jgi:putative membrane protein
MMSKLRKSLNFTESLSTFRYSLRTMKKILSQPDREYLNNLVSETEKRLDVQIVLAVIRRCDSYAEIPWKAFAFGSSVAGLITFLLNVIYPVWITSSAILYSIGAVLAAGILLSLSTVFIHPFARTFLNDHRAETEVKQYSHSVFLEHEVFATRNRNGLLLLVSLFERKVYLLPDSGLHEMLGKKEIHQVIEPMQHLLKHDEIKKAFEEGLIQVVKILEKPGSTPSGSVNELSDQIIEEEGI